jgi:hypothetical protein
VNEIEDLVHRADLDGLVRLIDKFCGDADWAGLFELRNRSRTAVTTGRQLWPAATLAEYRLALWAPAEWAALVLDEESGRFTIGPLTEVVAQRHRFDDLHARLAGGPRLGFVAHECALRGQTIPTEVANPLEIPFELQPWEPPYGLAEYSDEGVTAAAPKLPAAAEFVTMSVAVAGAGQRVDDPEVELAVRQLIEPWITSSDGRAEIVAVEGSASDAVFALGVTAGRLAPMTPSMAMAWLAWAGATGGAHGRRRGGAIGRFGAWWVMTSLADLADHWPVAPDQLNEAIAPLEWYWWDAGEPHLGWELQLAVADPAEGLRLGDQRPRRRLTAAAAV